MNPTLDPYLQKISEASNVLNNAKNEREAGVAKMKTDSGYADKQTALDTATRTLYETQKRLDSLPENVKQRTSGRPVTQAQMSRILASESDPLAAQARSAAMSRQEADSSLSRLDQAIKDWIGQYNSDISNRVTGLGMESDALFKNFQAQEAKAVRDQEMEFQREMARIQKEQADQDRANQLKMAQLSMPQYSPINSNSSDKYSPNGIDISQLKEIKDEAPDDFGKVLGDNLSLIGNGFGNVFDPNAWQKNIVDPFASLFQGKGWRW